MERRYVLLALEWFNALKEPCREGPREARSGPPWQEGSVPHCTS